MKMTRSKDGVMRATIWVDYRISDVDRELIAFVVDYEEGKRAEIVAAIRLDEFWRDDIVQTFWREKEQAEDVPASPENGELVDALGNEQCSECGAWGPCASTCGQR